MADAQWDARCARFASLSDAKHKYRQTQASGVRNITPGFEWIARNGVYLLKNLWISRIIVVSKDFLYFCIVRSRKLFNWLRYLKILLKPYWKGASNDIPIYEKYQIKQITVIHHNADVGG